VAFYKVVVVVGDVKGQLGVTAFEMDQSSVMPPQPGAPIPKAPFDPGRFSVDQVTLSEYGWGAAQLSRSALRQWWW
jgi:hypothetical protein